MRLNKFGDNLRQFRELAGYTQEELADKVNISHSFYVKLEHKTHIPSIETIISLCDVLHIPLDFLMKDGGFRSFQEYSASKMYQELRSMSDDELRVFEKTIETQYKLLQELRTKNNE